MKIRKWEIALLAAILIAIFVGSVSSRQTELSENLIRLHVVANSDSEEDQALKLSVRDGILEELEEILKGCNDKAEAEALSAANVKAGV